MADPSGTAQTVGTESPLATADVRAGESVSACGGSAGGGTAEMARCVREARLWEGVLSRRLDHPRPDRDIFWFRPREASDVASRWWVRAVATLLLLSPLLALLPSAAAAQSDIDVRLTLRSCISERGWRTDVADCTAIVDVVRERMRVEGGSYEANIRALAPRLHNGCRVERTWLCELDVDCERPRGLTATWERERGALPSRRSACLATVAEVRAALAGASVCSDARHWGSDEDLRRRRLAGFRWVAAECVGALLNNFGRLYRRAER